MTSALRSLANTEFWSTPISKSRPVSDLNRVTRGGENCKAAARSAISTRHSAEANVTRAFFWSNALSGRYDQGYLTPFASDLEELRGLQMGTAALDDQKWAAKCKSKEFSLSYAINRRQIEAAFIDEEAFTILAKKTPDPAGFWRRRTALFAEELVKLQAA